MAEGVRRCLRTWLLVQRCHDGKNGSHENGIFRAKCYIRVRALKLAHTTRHTCMRTHSLTLPHSPYTRSNALIAHARRRKAFGKNHQRRRGKRRSHHPKTTDTPRVILYMHACIGSMLDSFIYFNPSLNLGTAHTRIKKIENKITNQRSSPVKMQLSGAWLCWRTVCLPLDLWITASGPSVLIHTKPRVHGMPSNWARPICNRLWRIGSSSFSYHYSLGKPLQGHRS